MANAKMKMDYYVNIELREKTRFWEKTTPVKSCGIRHSTFYMDGDPSKVVSHSDVWGVYVMKDNVYKKVDFDTFIALYRTLQKSA